MDPKSYKAVVMVLMFVLCSAYLVTAQSTIDISVFTTDCKDTYTTVYDDVPVYKDRTVNHQNGTVEVIKDLVRTDKVARDVLTTVCTDTLTYEDKPVDYKLQGYNCKSEGDYTICDSIRDGDGDGKCDINGGESCVRISKDGKVTHKNSMRAWPAKDTFMPVPKLEVRG